eukprot:363797-Chlamydomonas_euryale.AAC.6
MPLRWHTACEVMGGEAARNERLARDVFQVINGLAEQHMRRLGWHTARVLQRRLGAQAGGQAGCIAMLQGSSLLRVGLNLLKV